MWPFSSSIALRSVDQLQSEYDFIIVGGGNAGCVIARRLAERQNCTVLLVEKGDAGDSWLHRTGLISLHHFSDGKHSDALESTHDAQLARSCTLITGSGLGGSTRINGGQYTYGVPAQFNHWNQAVKGRAGWSFSEVKPYFHKVEKFIGPITFEDHGIEGPLSVRSYVGFYYNSSAQFHNAAQKIGLPAIQDTHSPHKPSTCVHKMAFTLDSQGTRQSSYRAYLPKEFINGSSDRLHICTQTLARKLKFTELKNGSVRIDSVELQAVGTSYSRVITVKKEAILACGALRSPQLLLLSGIGPRDHLTSLGIPIVKDCPGVGEHLQDHLILSVGFHCPLQDSLWAMTRSPRTLIKQIFDYLWHGQGWFLGTVVETEIFALSSLIGGDGAPLPLSPDQIDASDPKNLPDIGVLASPIADPRGENVDRSKGFLSLNPALLRTSSRGRVRLSSSNPHADPVCDMNYLAASEDRVALRAAIRLAMRLADEMRSSGYPIEDLDVPQSMEDDMLDEYIRLKANTMFHYSSTCRMAPKSEGGVVDDDLRVHGISNLRVCDASVFPDIPATHPQALVYAIAEKCAGSLE